MTNGKAIYDYSVASPLTDLVTYGNAFVKECLGFLKAKMNIFQAAHLHTEEVHVRKAHPGQIGEIFPEDQF